MIPFLPKAVAQEFLEEHDLSEQQRYEIEAELGASAFYGGATAVKAMEIAHWALSEQDREWLASPSGQRYTERFEAAQFVTSAITSDMRVQAPMALWGIAPRGTLHVPEFYPELAGLFPRPAPSDDIPF